MSRAFRLGIFIVGALAILIVGVFLIGNKRYLFGSTYKLTAQFDDVSGLVNGADVHVGGIHAGTVSAIELPKQPGGKVTVVMRMEKATSNIVRQDSTAEIKTEGLLGDKYVAVSYGSASAAAIANGDTILGQIPPTIEDQANKATQEADKTMAQVGSAVSTFQDDAEALKHNFLLRGYFKKRGYYDQSTLAENQIARLPGQTPVKEFTFDVNRIFNKGDNAALKDRRALNEAGKFMQQNPFSVAVVSASTEAAATAQQRLEAEARAKAVRDYLSQQFNLDGSKVKTLGGGNESAPNGVGKLQIRVYGAESRAAQLNENVGG